MAKDVGSNKPRREKLGVQPGQRVYLDTALVDLADNIVGDLAVVGAVGTGVVGEADVALVLADTLADLAKVDVVRAGMPDHCAIWVVWPKGNAQLNENHVRAHALRGDLVDVKVMSWSATHSALRLVVRKALRKTAKKKQTTTTKSNAKTTKTSNAKTTKKSNAKKATKKKKTATKKSNAKTTKKKKKKTTTKKKAKKKAAPRSRR